MSDKHIIIFKYSIEDKEYKDKMYFSDIDHDKSHNPFQAVKHHLESKGIKADKIFNHRIVIEKKKDE